MERRDLFRLTAAGLAGAALADGATAEAQERGEASLMLFPGNYTWSAAVRGVIATSLWGGADLGEVYKVVAALKGRAGEGPAWFAAWSAMAAKVARLAAAAEARGHSATASAAYMRAANYYQTGERLLQPRSEESQRVYARAVALFKKGIGDVPFLAIEAVEVPFAGKSLPGYFVKSRDAGAAPLPTLVDKAFQASLSVPGEHVMWVLGVDNIEAALKKLEGFRLAGVAEKVACPYLLTHGERDAQIPMEDARALFAAIGAKDKTLKVFTFEEGGYEHCQGDNLTIGIAYIADWLAERLATKRRA